MSYEVINIYFMTFLDFFKFSFIHFIIDIITFAGLYFFTYLWDPSYNATTIEVIIVELYFNPSSN